jgi:putative transport protein
MSGAVPILQAGCCTTTYFVVTGTNDPSIAMGYAVAYPLGVCRIILTFILKRVIFKVNFEQENKSFQSLMIRNSRAHNVFVAGTKPRDFW